MPSDSQPIPPVVAEPHTAYVQQCINNRLAVLEARVLLIKRLEGTEPAKRVWRGRKRDRVLAYFYGIVRRSKQIWTWINPHNIARALSKDPKQTVSAKTVWRVLRDLAESGHPELRVRVCQRQTKKNWHFQWLISHGAKLAHDHEPLFFRADGKSRNLRPRCRKKTSQALGQMPLLYFTSRKENLLPRPPFWGPRPPASRRARKDFTASRGGYSAHNLTGSPSLI